MPSAAVFPDMKKLLAVSMAAALAGCQTIPPPPAAPYRAIGTEPFWNVLIDEHHITFTEPDQQQPLRQPTPPAINGFAGPIYQTPRISVNIVKNVQCSDGMSDRVYPDKVQVTVDGRQLNGCGGL